MYAYSWSVDYPDYAERLNQMAYHYANGNIDLAIQLNRLSLVPKE